MPTTALRLSIAGIALACVAGASAADLPYDSFGSWFDYQLSGAKDAWDHGSPTLYVTGYAHHDRDTYTPEKIDSFNEQAWGGGVGCSVRRDNGDHFGWYVLAFKDSHSNVTGMAGLGALTYWPKRADVAVGLGYTVFLATRPDIFSNVPFPGILPLAALRLDKVEVLGTYIPKLSGNTTGNGNVGFIFGRINF